MKSRIAFGSCNDQDRENNLWPVIASREPTAFVWGGDAIYADEVIPNDSIIPQRTELQCATPERLETLYKRQQSVEGYQQLLKQNVAVFGTFDDHDYGCNNADRTFPYSTESGKAYVDFLREAPDSAMRQRAEAGYGVYGVRLFDFSRPFGQQLVNDTDASIDPDVSGTSLLNMEQSYSNRSVAVFVLDVRTNKTPWKKGHEAFRPDMQGDFLGERQWQWFEAAIRRSRAAVNVIVSGLQVHADRFPDGNVAEAWGKYPTAQQRLFDAILQKGVEAPILISGDVHMAEFMRKDCVRADNNNNFQGQPRPLFEMTTSGMTHSWGTLASPPIQKEGVNTRPTWKERYSSYLGRNMMRTLHAVCPWTDLLEAPTQQVVNGTHLHGGGEGARGGLQFSLEKNFGELEFDWEERVVIMRAIGETPDAPPLLMATMRMDQLSGHEPVSSQVSVKDFRQEAKDRFPMEQRPEWICVNHRGRHSQVSHLAGHVVTGMVLTTFVPVPLLIPSIALMLVIRKVSKSTKLGKLSK